MKTIYPQTATIAAGASLSDEIRLPDGYALIGIVMPSVWTAADITFQARPEGGSLADLHDAAGNEITVTAAASRQIVLDPVNFEGVQYLKLRSGTSAVPVNQAAARTITLISRPT